MVPVPRNTQPARVLWTVPTHLHCWSPFSSWYFLSLASEGLFFLCFWFPFSISFLGFFFFSPCNPCWCFPSLVLSPLVFSFPFQWMMPLLPMPSHHLDPGESVSLICLLLWTPFYISNWIAHKLLKYSIAKPSPGLHPSPAISPLSDIPRCLLMPAHLLPPFSSATIFNQPLVKKKITRRSRVMSQCALHATPWHFSVSIHQQYKSKNLEDVMEHKTDNPWNQLHIKCKV